MFGAEISWSWIIFAAADGENSAFGAFAAGAKIAQIFNVNRRTLHQSRQRVNEVGYVDAGRGKFRWFLGENKVIWSGRKNVDFSRPWLATQNKLIQKLMSLEIAGTSWKERRPLPLHPLVSGRNYMHRVFEIRVLLFLPLISQTILLFPNALFWC